MNPSAPSGTIYVVANIYGNPWRVTAAHEFIARDVELNSQPERRAVVYMGNYVGLDKPDDDVATIDGLVPIPCLASTKFICKESKSCISKRAGTKAIIWKCCWKRIKILLPKYLKD